MKIENTQNEDYPCVLLDVMYSISMMVLSMMSVTFAMSPAESPHHSVSILPTNRQSHQATFSFSCAEHCIQYIQSYISLFKFYIHLQVVSESDLLFAVGLIYNQTINVSIYCIRAR